MGFPSLQLTDAGRAIIVGALAGGSIEFTNIGVGDGNAPTNPNALTELVNPIKKIGIGEITTGDGCANMTAVLDNANLTDGFWWKEICVYALDANEDEVVYAYAHAGEYADYIPAYSSTSYLRTTINMTVIVGSAESVSAIISEYIGYVTTETYEGHTSNTNNPHSVTKDQVGLGNVPNVSTNDQTPTFSQYPAPAQLASGLTLQELFSRLMADVAYLLDHCQATNPHHITLSKIGAAAAAHAHSAADITSGKLSVNRGGTGASNAATARANLGVNSIYHVEHIETNVISFAATEYVIETINISAISGYTPVAIADWAVTSGGSGSADSLITVNNLELYSGYVKCHLKNTKAGENTCKMKLSILYIKDL